MKTNMFAWVEIPVNNMDRAIAFYEKTFDVQIQKVNFGGLLMGWFPSAEGAPGANGTLIQQESYVPSHEGTLVYFSSEDVQQELDRLEEAGGKILQPKTQISEDHGFMAVFEDTEGNRVAIHSQH